jgi:hypothetical protein
MPTLPRLREFDRQLAAVVRPVLEPLGFIAGVHRCFRRIGPADHGTIAHIVHFQVGIKSMTGKFTVNLCVYHSKFCLHPGDVTPETATFGSGLLELWVRVAQLEPVRPSLIGRILGRSTEPPDRWWEQSADPVAMAAALREPLALVLAHAPAWFEQHGTEKVCREAYERVQARLSSRRQTTGGG